MHSDPKTILAEFGIDVTGKDPDGQYQWKMLAMKAGSEERKRLEKAWSAFVLDRKEVEVAAPRKARSETAHGSSATIARPGWWKRLADRRMLIAVTVIGAVVLWLVIHLIADHRDAAPTATGTRDWRSQYEAIKIMVNENAHQDEHHEEFILLAEAARSAIEKGEADAMLDQLNSDLAKETNTTTTRPITTLAAHGTQWRIVVEALILNKKELLDHDAFKGHHEGEL